ncbi:MAG: energy-coupled thiamine transporter ThiT [Clostridia bacterium]|nr:energy-coupled thiamine transporter ThiT [Clostridia bacterium]
MLFNLLSSAKPIFLSDKVEPFAIWITVGIVCALVVSWLILFLIKPTRKISGTVAKKMLFAFLIYALALGIFMLALEIEKKYADAYLDYNWVNKDIINYVFIPLLATAILSLCSAITLFVLAKLKKGKALKITGIVCGTALIVAIITCLVFVYLYYKNHIVGDGYYTDEAAKFNSTALIIGACVLTAIVVAVSFIVGRKNKAPYTARCLAFAGVCVGLSFALSYIKFEAAWLQGGSITLVSFLPICLFAYTYGMKKGLLVGLIYGLLQAIQDPFIVHPAQFLLDYPIAFSMIALSGLLTDLKVLENLPQLKFAIGVSLTGIFRYLTHVISGVFAFGANALNDGATNFLAYSAAYNSYVFIDIALVIVVGVILLSSKGFKKELVKLGPAEVKKEN